MNDIIAENYFVLNKEPIYKMIKHCLTNVPFYVANWNFQLPEITDFTYDFFSNNIPILEKSFVRDTGNLFVSNNVNIAELNIEATSGSEGQPIKCYKSNCCCNCYCDCNNWYKYS